MLRSFPSDVPQTICKPRNKVRGRRGGSGPAGWGAVLAPRTQSRRAGHLSILEKAETSAFLPERDVVGRAPAPSGTSPEDNREAGRVCQGPQPGRRGVGCQGKREAAPCGADSTPLPEAQEGRGLDGHGGRLSLEGRSVAFCLPPLRAERSNTHDLTVEMPFIQALTWSIFQGSTARSNQVNLP